jgi:hypothetical protein
MPAMIWPGQAYRRLHGDRTTTCFEAANDYRSVVPGDNMPGARPAKLCLALIADLSHHVRQSVVDREVSRAERIGSGNFFGCKFVGGFAALAWAAAPEAGDLIRTARRHLDHGPRSAMAGPMAFYNVITVSRSWSTASSSSSTPMRFRRWQQRDSRGRCTVRPRPTPTRFVKQFRTVPRPPTSRDRRDLNSRSAG